MGNIRKFLGPRKSRKHGASGWGDKKPTPEYRAWLNMIARCENPNYPKFHLWGGRGVRVAEVWRRDFLAFLRDVGDRPSPTHSIDRFPDRDGDYAPGNVRWASRVEQNINRRPMKKRRSHV